MHEAPKQPPALEAEYVTVHAAAHYLGLSARSVRYYCGKGTIPCTRIGRRILIPRVWLRTRPQ